MKNLKLIGFLMILTSSLLFIQCTSDPIPGPQGIAGVDGVDGVDGINGQDGTDAEASCVACHSNSHREPIHTAFEMSDHFIETSIPWAGMAPLSSYTNRGGSESIYGSCNACHSNEGYIDYVETGMTAEAYENVSGVSCTTCHSKHSTFDFENDGHDYALRSLDPVDLYIGTGVIDYEGTSNSCIICHQPRRTPPTDDGSGMFNVPPHYGPHYGAQTTMLEGIQGALIPGSEGYPGVGTATHRTAASCVSCHMGDPNNEDGGHTFKPTLNSCTTCHTAATDFDWHGVQTEVETLMHELEVLLIANGILDENGSLVTGMHPVGVSNAYWNWEFVHQDGSYGVHNPKYTLALLKNSIEYLESLD